MFNQRLMFVLKSVHVVESWVYRATWHSIFRPCPQTVDFLFGRHLRQYPGSRSTNFPRLLARENSIEARRLRNFRPVELRDASQGVSAVSPRLEIPST